MNHTAFTSAVVTTLLAIAATLPARAAVIDIVWDAQGRFQRKDSVAPGKFVEVCGKLARGQAIGWDFEADRALDFNIHYHVGKEVVYPAQQPAVARGGGTLVVPVDQDYCWMWTNKADVPARLELRLSRP